MAFILSLSLASIGGCKGGDKPAADNARGGRGGRGGGAGLTYAADVLRVESKKVEYLVTAPGTIEAFERVIRL